MSNLFIWIYSGAWGSWNMLRGGGCKLQKFGNLWTILFTTQFFRKSPIPCFISDASNWTEISQTSCLNFNRHSIVLQTLFPPLQEAWMFIKFISRPLSFDPIYQLHSPADMQLPAVGTPAIYVTVLFRASGKLRAPWRQGTPCLICWHTPYWNWVC
jgi:hypothetical protein